VQFIWVKGHASIPENERCDRLAVEASHGASLPKDIGYVENKDETLI
jgi:ribonuclease HI